MRELFVSLGHNSSAVLAVDGKVVRGFEQERIDRRKSSSAYPRGAIDLALRTVPADVAYVGHWFDRYELESNEYLDLDHLRSVAKRVVSLTPEFTHHDSHASAACGFLASHRWYRDPAYVVVCDGFGNDQECFSFYDAHPADLRPRLRHRTYGYKMSLGLMYQYTTEYLGMKPNQDEYKLLGYESHVTDHVPKEECMRILGRVQRDAYDHANRMLASKVRPEPTSDLIDKVALDDARSYWWAVANRWRRIWPDALSEDAVRSCVAFCAQGFLEACVDHLITALSPAGRRMLVVTGGSFHNVKLNRRLLLRQDRPRVFAHPLAGDQGAALGHSVVDLGDLCWGEREFGHLSLPVGASYSDEATWPDVAGPLIEAGHVVNVVRGAMEFGPRALCNTTTLALPTRANVTRINSLNQRDEFMPMAPVMTRQSALRFLRHGELLMVPVSDRYMITTCAYMGRPPDRIMGVAHRDPLVDTWTARPQVVDDDGVLGRMLGTMPDEALINTSFNYHGQPIVFTQADAIRTHQMQVARAHALGIDEPITLLVTR